MKNIVITLLCLSLCSLCYATEWKSIASNNKTRISLQSSQNESSVLRFSLDGFGLKTVTTENGDADIVSITDGVPILSSGSPDLPKMTASLIIPDQAEMGCSVISSKYTEYQNIDIAPSKGSISRNTDPATVPYTYGSVYRLNEFYPEDIVDLNEPYIFRDYRGQTVNFYPVQYNAVTKVLRVYSEITVEVKPVGNNGKNRFERKKKLTSVDQEYGHIYKKRFLNFPSLKYTPIEEEGSMLIICHDSFISAMQPFVAWKKLKGIDAEMVDVATIGDAGAIEAYVTDYYNASKNLKYLLLVGDHEQVPSTTVTNAERPESTDYSDQRYGYIPATDAYPEVIVGRFSGTSVADIETQVERTIRYEKGMTGAETYLNKGLALASGEESDDVNAITQIVTDMEAFTYQDVNTITSENGAQVTDRINQGVGFIPHSGHGSTTGLASVDFTTSDCNNLTNTTMWPFMYCLACNVGNFTHSTCLAEAMLRASSDGEPTGFVATQMSIISQPWYEPYAALHEQVDILTEQKDMKWSFGGIAVDGTAKMIDDFSEYGPWVAETWVVFGDPSLLVFTDTPSAMDVSHAPTITLGATSFTVDCDEVDALISLTADGEIAGVGYSTGGLTDIAIDPVFSTTSATIQVTITAKNRLPYMQDVEIVSATASPVCDFSADQITITEGETITFSDLTTNYPVSWLWTFNGGTPETSTKYSPSVKYTTQGIYDVTLVAENTLGSDSVTKTAYITVEPATDSPLADFTASKTDIKVGLSVDYTDLSTNYPISFAWTFEGGTPESSTEQNPKDIAYNAAGTYAVSLTVTNSVGSDTVTKTGYITVSLDYPDGMGHCGDEYISNVTVGDINNDSDCENNGYSDYTSLSTEMEVGGTYELSIRNDAYWSGDKMGCWIDWNIDGDWDDENEEISVDYSDTQGDEGRGIQNGIAAITVPSDAVAGVTRMRVRVQFGDVLAPSESTSYGEVEDYSIIVR